MSTESEWETIVTIQWLELKYYTIIIGKTGANGHYYYTHMRRERVVNFDCMVLAEYVRVLYGHLYAYPCLTIKIGTRWATGKASQVKTD